MCRTAALPTGGWAHVDTADAWGPPAGPGRSAGCPGSLRAPSAQGASPPDPLSHTLSLLEHMNHVQEGLDPVCKPSTWPLPLRVPGPRPCGCQGHQAPNLGPEQQGGPATLPPRPPPRGVERAPLPAPGVPPAHGLPSSAPSHMVSPLPMGPHPNLMTSVNTPFPCKPIFIGAGVRGSAQLWGDAT